MDDAVSVVLIEIRTVLRLGPAAAGIPKTLRHDLRGLALAHQVPAVHLVEPGTRL
jgi:hypothetical protein